ncbi:PLP-dependent aminotransferase family protein [Pelosinus sp. UFO1]|uniref:MocR-like pyridoxine biosynthesis transcription factor PdxR n=1 Tax=Pelosinus sp. UFO1 TaxID=484770 RepID=UPI0004D0CBF0|nr:PLP-dependent aminotransferase family protein [Pelosinus sp. UFO1]AIF53490.1 transcriptional regulator, GntR family with aminotransferase domain containing protein [Pelosinus sp. UFO1]
MFVLNEKLKTPLYTQLYEQIRTQILSGHLSPGTKIPSSRKLSNDLHISRTTVEMAYQQLYSEGYIYAKSRIGYYIEALDLNSVSTPLESAVIPTEVMQPTNIQGKYDLRYGKLDPGLIPFSHWQRLINKCIREEKDNLTDYGAPNGNIGLRKEIARYLHDYRGVKCSVEQIILTSGTQHSLTLACQLLKEKTDSIAVEDPGFFGAHSVFANAGFTILPIPLNHHGLAVKVLAATKAGAVYVTPSHQFPTGRIMPITRRLRLVAWARTNNTFIIEDDYSSHLRYNVKPIQSLQSLASDKVIYMGSFSKALLPSLRTAYVVLPEQLIKSSRTLLSGIPSSVPHIIQRSLEFFMQEGHWERHLRKMTRQLKKRHDMLMGILKAEFKDHICISGMNAGVHLLVELDCLASEQELIAAAGRKGVQIRSSGNLWMNQSDEGKVHVLLGFSAISPELISKAVQALHNAWLPYLCDKPL